MFLVDYADGLRAAALMLGDDGYVEQFAYAGRRGGSIDAFAFQPEPGPEQGALQLLRPQRGGLPALRCVAEPRGAHAADHRILEGGDDLAPSRRRTRRHTTSGHLLRPRIDAVRRPSGPHPSAAAAIPVPLPEPGATPAAEPILIDRDGTIRRSAAARSES